MGPAERPSKREAFLTFLADGWVSLHLDARRNGVNVPHPFAVQPHLVLQYGRDMPIPIPDLDVTDAGVAATLSFSRTPHKTYVPWDAVYIVACTDGRGIIYAEDVPEEVALLAPGGTSAGTRAPAAADAEPRAAAESARRLRSVPLDDTEAGVDEDGAPARRRRRPQLRLVK